MNGHHERTAHVARPDLRFLFAHPAHLIALGFGSGLSRVAPGMRGREQPKTSNAKCP